MSHLVCHVILERRKSGDESFFGRVAEIFEKVAKKVPEERQCAQIKYSL